MTTQYSSVIPAARGRAGNDPIFIWHGEATARAAAGDDILNVTIGALTADDGRLCTMPTVIETMKRLQTGQAAGYAPIAGIPPYRAAVIHDLFGDGPLASQAVAVATPGGSGAIYEAVANFLDEGQSMLVPGYFWGPYSNTTTHSGRSLDPFPMFTADGSFDMQGMADGLRRHMKTQGRALVVLNFPCHNPTGYSLNRDEWEQVCDVVEEVGQQGPLAVLVDAAYMEFAGSEARAWVDFVPRMLEFSTVLVAWTASKSMAQYGARTGALVALHRDPKELKQIENALGFSARSTWSNCHHLGQLAVTELITNPELVPKVRAERQALMALLQTRIDAFNEQAREAYLPTPRFDAGFFVAVFTADQDAAAAAMREKGVYVVPLRGGVRVAICATPVAAVPRLVDALKAGVAAGG